MAYKDQREFIKALEKIGDAQEIEKEVDWNLEAGAILRRTYELGLPAPFFQNIKGYPKGYRMFGGTLSSYARVAMSMGLPPDTSYRDLMETYITRKKKLLKPVLVRDAPCKENIVMGKDVNLFQFPAPMLHEGDGGRYLCTWHTQVTRDPDSGWVNWGMYRAMIHTKNTLGGLLEPHQHIGYHYFRKFESFDKPMPVAIAIGPEPVSAMMSMTKVPYMEVESEIAGALRQAPVEVVKCETVDLEVPATSEIVIEAEIYPRERVFEGPFGEFTGYRASPRDLRPVYRVKAITYRNNPILTVSCMGVPIDDCHAPMGVTMGAELLMELRRKGVPVVDVACYAECAGLMVAVSVKPPYANIADKIAHIVWGMEGGDVRPYVIVLDDDVDPYNIWQVMHSITTKCHPYRGIHRIERAQGTALLPFEDRRERLFRLGAKAYFDCTWPLDWDPSIAVPPRSSFDKIYSKEVQEHVLNNWKDYGFTRGIPEQKGRKAAVKK